MSSEAISAPPSPDDITPDELLVGFSTSHIVRWFFVAVLLHAVVIGGMSVGTIRDFLDPEGAKARAEAKLAAAKAGAEPAAASGAPAASAAPAASGAPADAAAASPPTGAAPQADAAKTPIEQATTEAAKPEDIPDAPDDLGLSIEDTNVK